MRTGITITNAREKVEKLLKLALIFLIRCYQFTFSQHRGAFAFSAPFSGCRFWPSCSNYTQEALRRYGLWKGLGKGVWRIVRCNPWNAGGVDEP